MTFDFFIVGEITCIFLKNKHFFPPLPALPQHHFVLFFLPIVVYEITDKLCTYCVTNVTISDIIHNNDVILFLKKGEKFKF